MTIPNTCVTKLSDFLAGKATKADIDRVSKDLDRLYREALLDGISPADAVRSAGERYARQSQMAILVARRNTALNAIRLRERLSYVRDTWKGREAEGLRALLTGSIEGRKGARASVAREQRVLMGQYFGQVTTELERSGHMTLFKTGQVDRQVARALWELNSDAPRLDGMPADAVAIARIIHKGQEAARADANQAGAWIGKLRGWIVRQSHDPWKLAKLGRDRWLEGIIPRLDWARMEAQNGPIKDRAKFLGETYVNLVTGVHLQSPGAVNNTGFKGPGNLAKRMSEERVLHFKSADDWFDYNEEFGFGSVRESVFRGLKSSAENTGLMRVFGPNPEALYGRLVEKLRRDVRESADTKAIERFEKAIAPDGWLSRRMTEVTGRANQPVDQLWARRAANVRSLQSMAKLGGAVISSITDLATYGSEMSYQGRGFLSGIAEGIGAIGRGLPNQERREMLSSMGVFFDSVLGDITRTGSLDESTGGQISRWQRQFFKWNLLSWWTETLRSSAALSMSHHLALQADTGWTALRPEMRRALELFEISEADWNVLRTSAIRKDADGTAFIVPEGVEPELAQKFRRYIVDRSETAVLEPDADSRAMLRQGTRPGTVIGEMARMVAQFKGFPTAYARQVLGREIYGRGEKAFADGSVRGLAQLIVTTTVLGYAAMAAKDALKGRTPRDPTKKETILKAFTQSGGAGIYGDFLFGEYNRFGQSPLETAAGPVLGTGADVTRVWARMVRGEADAGDFMRLSVDNTPFLNLFYSRIALDYLILYDMQEAIAPGTLRRMERRAQRENGQTFLAPPSADRLRPFTQ